VAFRTELARGQSGGFLTRRVPRKLARWIWRRRDQTHRNNSCEAIRRVYCRPSETFRGFGKRRIDRHLFRRAGGSAVKPLVPLSRFLGGALGRSDKAQFAPHVANSDDGQSGISAKHLVTICRARSSAVGKQAYCWAVISVGAFGTLAIAPFSQEDYRVMARYRIVLLRDDGSEVAEMMVDALWRLDAVDMAERVVEDEASSIGYEVWQGSTRIAQRGPGEDLRR